MHGIIRRKKTKVYQEHDKIFRKALEDKKEVAWIINKIVKLKRKVKEEELEKYKTKYVTPKLKNREADIVYKVKGKDIYFLIEHQTKVDYEMTERIAEYQKEIIESGIDEKRRKRKEYRQPVVIPIVMYTGRKKWDAKTRIEERQVEVKGYDKVRGEYYIIDINNYEEEELLKDKQFLTKIFLIEKAKDTKSLILIVEKIIEEMNEKEGLYSKEQKEILKIIIKLVLSKKIGAKEEKRLLRKIEGGKTDMLAIEETIIAENKMLVARGRREAKKETAQKMLEKNMTIDIIKEITGEITGLNEKEINKLASKK